MRIPTLKGYEITGIHTPSYGPVSIDLVRTEEGSRVQKMLGTTTNVAVDYLERMLEKGEGTREEFAEIERILTQAEEILGLVGKSIHHKEFLIPRGKPQFIYYH